MWDAYCSASEPCLGIHLGLEELAQAVTGAPRVWSAQERSGEAWTAPLSRSQVLGSGAKVRVRLSSSAWATAAALGAEVEQPHCVKDERLGLAGPASGVPVGNCLGPEEPGSTLWSLQGSGG